MFSRCLFCARSFSPNNRLEHFRTSSRVAYDPARGRLWAICASCGGWSLAPIEERWEALEELEKLVRDRAKLLIQGENIALFEFGKLQIVRVGRAGRTEESWWRYGAELSRRRERLRKTVDRDRAFDRMFWLAVLGIPIAMRSDEALRDAARTRAFGRSIDLGVYSCTRCGRRLSKLHFANLGTVRILPGHDLTLALPCFECESSRAFEITGADAMNTLSRVLAYQNFRGANEDEVRTASRSIESAGSAANLLLSTRADAPWLSALTQTGALALEIALNESIERRLLGAEVQELDARWQQAEQIASIVDNDLTFQLRRL